MRQVEILAVDFAATLPLLRSVAVAKEVSQGTKYGWRRSDIMRIANLSGEVGMWEAEVPNSAQLKAAIQAATRDRALQLVRVAAEGPLPLVKWLYGQMVLRDKFLQNYHEQVRAFNDINASTLQALDASVKLAKGGRFVANVGLITGSVAVGLYGMTVAVGGTFTGSTAIAGTYTAGAVAALPIIGLVKSVSVAVIKDWNKAPSAKMASVAFEVGKAGVNEGTGAAGGRMVQGKGPLAVIGAATHADLLIQEEAKREALRVAQAKLAQSEAKLGRMERLRIGGQTKKGAQQRAARVGQQRAAVEAERQVVKQGSKAVEEATARRIARAHWLRLWGGRVMMGSTVAFAVWDGYDAIAELGE